MVHLRKCLRKLTKTLRNVCPPVWPPELLQPTPGLMAQALAQAQAPVAQALAQGLAQGLLR